MSSRLLLPIILLLALANRLFMSVQAFYSSFDTSTPGLMALHILEGARPLFYYGQNYMGALEAYLAAGYFWLLGPSLTALSLSPITFAVLWVYAMYLLFRELYGEEAGLVAAATTALPGWHTVWYTSTSYGGYPAALFFGTVALWLCVRLARRAVSPREEWVHILALGAVAGLGLWTHYLTATYLLVGALVLLPWLVRRRFAPGLLAKFAAGGVLLVAGLLPAFLAYGKYGGSETVALRFSPRVLAVHLKIFLERVVPPTVLWSPEHPLLLNGLVVMALVVATAAALVCIRRGPARGWMLLPGLLLLVFLALYLPHFMARLGAPRYAMSAASMVLAGVFALPVAYGGRRMRRVVGACLAVWLCYHAGASVHGALLKAPAKDGIVAGRAELLAHVRSTGADMAEMVGGTIFGHEGQSMTLMSGMEPPFVSLYEERYQPDAQRMETATNVALAVERSVVRKTVHALKDLGVAYQVIRNPWVFVLYDLRTKDVPRNPVPVSTMSGSLDDASEGDAAGLFDRTLETAVEGTYQPASGFTLDLGRVVDLHSVWFMGTGDDPLLLHLPEGYALSVSNDGRTFREAHRVARRMVPSYRYGPKVYLKGYLGMMECRFPPIAARYLRFTFDRGQRDAEKWVFSEVFVFERSEQEQSDALEDLARAIAEHDIDFTVSDRWMSARLMDVLPAKRDGYPVYPRYNPKFKDTLLSREVVPRRGWAVAPCAEVADSCEALLHEVFGEKAVRKRLSLGAYDLLVLDDVPEPAHTRLVWNSHTLLKTRQAVPAWH